MRCWLLRRHKLHIPRPAASGRSRPFRCASSQNRNRVAGLRFCIFCTRRRNVGFCYAIAHAFAVGAKKPHTAATRASRRRTVPAAKGCKDANRSRCYPLALLLRQAPEPLVGAADVYKRQGQDASRRLFAIMLGDTVVGELQLKQIEHDKKECTLSIHMPVSYTHLFYIDNPDNINRW